MVEYYKTDKGYYYKKTTKKTTRIKKDEYKNKTKNGGKISIKYKGKLNGGGKNCECNNPIDLITLDPIEKDFDENNINNFIIKDEKGICYCFKIYDLYKWVFTTDVAININQINDKKQKDFNPYTDIPIPSNILEDLVKKYKKWTEYKGIGKTITYNGVKFNRKDFRSILDEFEQYKTEYSQRSSNTRSRNILTLFMNFAEGLLEYYTNNNSNNYKHSNNNTRSVSSNSSGRASFSMSETTLKAIISYIRDKKLY